MLTRNSCVSVRVSSHLPVHIYLPGTCGRLVEVTEDLARYVFPASFLMVHNTRRGGEDHKAERTSWKHCRHPLLHLAQRNGVTWRDNTTLVETANKLDHDLAGAVVINDFKVTNVAVLLHDTQEPDHNPGRWTDENLTLAATLSVHNAHEGIVLHMLLAQIGRAHV